MRKLIPYGLIGLTLALMFLFGTLMPRADVSASAPAAIITPVSYDKSSVDSRYVVFFNNDDISATTRECRDLSDYDVADL